MYEEDLYGKTDSLSLLPNFNHNLFATLSLLYKKKKRIRIRNVVLITCLFDHVLDKYLDYFTTPYFVFLRDTISYLLLLGLHIVICVSPATVSFSALEWVILVFFIGRFLSEFKQYTNRAASKKIKKFQCVNEERIYDCQQSQNGQDEIMDVPIKVEDFRSRMVFSAIGKYFR